jgi:hypothetical protein
MPEGINQPKSKGDQLSQDESMERKAREQADLRLHFVEAISAKTGISLAKCFNDYTDLKLRLMGPDPEDEAAFKSHIERWEEFTNIIAQLPDHESRLDKIMQRFKEPTDRTDHRDDEYWPFRYDYVDDQGEPFVATHFGNMLPVDNVTEGPGLLSKERYEEQRAKLRAMFIEIKNKYPDVKEVRGRSWLYNVEAYRRLYPKVYGDSKAIAKGIYRGGGRWGQFRRSDGSVNPELRAIFYKNLKNLDPGNPEAAFPLQTWTVRAPIEEFYKEYGIE